MICVSCLLAGGAIAQEKEDVTAAYVVNASFEADNIAQLEKVTNSADGLRGYKVNAPQGWTVSNSVETVSLIVTADCYTDNNFGKVTTLSDGSQAYYLRVGWATGASSVMQTTKALPAGKYQLEVDVRSGYANQATSAVDIYAGTATSTLSFTQGSQGFFTSLPWTTATVYF